MWIFGKKNKSKQEEHPEDYVNLTTHLNNFTKKESEYIATFYSSDELSFLTDDIQRTIPYGYINVFISLDEESDLQEFLVKTELYLFIKQEYVSTRSWGAPNIPKKEYKALIELLKKNEARFHVPSLDISVGYNELKQLVKDDKICFSEYLDSKANPMGGGDSSEDSATDTLAKQ